MSYDNERFNRDIGEFYDFLQGPEDLMDFAGWRREKSRMETAPLGEVKRGGTDTIFVVMTPDPAKAPIRPMLEKQTTIYAWGTSPFFNESHWFNKGIAWASALGAKWIILMSDDLYEVTPIGKLAEALKTIDNTEFDTVWIDPFPDFYHSYEAYLAKRHPLENVLGRDHLKLARLCEKFGVETVVASKTPIRKPLHFWMFSTLFPRPYVGPSFKMSSDFCILSSEWCRKQGPEVLNELFVGFEDVDLSLRLRNAKSTTLDFRVGSEIGGTLGVGFPKALRELFNLSIFNRLLKEGRYG